MYWMINNFSSITALFSRSNRVSIDNHNKFKPACFVYKTLHGLVPPFIGAVRYVKIQHQWMNNQSPLSGDCAV